jgi:hypothetical protein
MMATALSTAVSTKEGDGGPHIHHVQTIFGPFSASDDSALDREKGRNKTFFPSTKNK